MSVGSDGLFEKTGLVPGSYTLRVTAHTTEPPPALLQVVVMENRFYVHSRLPSNPYCSVHLINCGMRVEKGTLTVEFTSSGLASQDCSEFDCCVDKVCRICESLTAILAFSITAFSTNTKAPVHSKSLASVLETTLLRSNLLAVDRATSPGLETLLYRLVLGCNNECS